MADPVETNVQPAAPRNYSTAKRVSLWLKKVGEDSYKELGNIISPKLAMDIQELEHYSNRRGVRSRDRIEIGQIKGSLNFQLDECNKRNLQNCFGGSEAAEASSVDVEEGNIFENPGGGQYVALNMEGIKAGSIIVEDTAEEGTPVVYTEDSLATDTTEDTAGGTWNNTTDPLNVVAATYPTVAAKGVGALIKVEDEVMRITAVGTNVTLSRGELGTTPAAHANGVSIFTSDGTNDYAMDLTGGRIYILTDGDLDDETTVPEFHSQWAKTVTTEAFQTFDGTPIRGAAKLQVLTPKGLRAVILLPSVTIKNDGDLDFGTGETWIAFPMQMEVLADGRGSLGTFHIIDQDQAL